MTTGVTRKTKGEAITDLGSDFSCKDGVFPAKLKRKAVGKLLAALKKSFLSFLMACKEFMQVSKQVNV